ncbi:hypothetical protein VISI1226_16673 [Vibrio sinaloensis DSM 21326]|uniref:PhoP regulatory network protein YrbL n=1 Tax=Vibrio sinaloensis DSM 21326 TaxID=945550 RepID=E8M541_PHOS4|nr:YrbL family protein [Vibrio sinaloensis]EGA70892.1 hypothetical protein VISI1226_16673 [Vibrio sinaloensis DSM 21326]
MLILDDKLLLGQGNERECYVHPDDQALCIKVYKPDMIVRSQNSIEYFYLKYLELKKVPFTHIPKCYRWIDTNKGKGLLIERILDGDGTPSLSMIEAIQKELVTKEVAKQLLVQLGDYLIKHRICISDINVDQVLLKNVNNQWVPMIIDGIGSRYFYTPKLPLIMLFPSFALRKTKTNWPLLIEKMMNV